MTVTVKYRVLTFALFAVTLPVVASAEGAAVQEFRIHIDQPAYTGLPVWIIADLGYPLETHYPAGSDNPGDFGPNQLEVMREGQVLSPRSAFFAVGAEGPGGEGWIASVATSTNRLPLHLRYAFDAPGTYSVRWTSVRHIIKDDRPAIVIVARSDWLSFEVNPSTPEQRESWLQKQLASVPGDPGQLVGDFLPSLLIAAPDPRVLRVVLDQLYSTEPVVSSCALNSLRLFRENDIRAQAVELLHERGPSEALASLLSWGKLFRGSREDFVQTLLPYLRSSSDSQVVAALMLLGDLVHPGCYPWPPDPETLARADGAVLAAAPRLVARSGAVRHQFAIYLGGIKSDEARDLLWQLVERGGAPREQALTALTWIGDERDLPRLGELLLKPGYSDLYGSDISGLAYSLIRGYGDRAIPYLERAVSESPYAFVQTESAKQLALKGRPEGFRFLLDAVQNSRFYKPEMVGWLKDYFPKDLPGNADDKTVIAFLNSRLGR